MAMTTDAKQALKETVRSLRAWLLVDLHDATESQWQLRVGVQNADLVGRTRAVSTGVDGRKIPHARLRSAVTHDGDVETGVAVGRQGTAKSGHDP
jgi:hypothetical protein